MAASWNGPALGHFLPTFDPDEKSPSPSPSLFPSLLLRPFLGLGPGRLLNLNSKDGMDHDQDQGEDEGKGEGEGKGKELGDG